MFLRATLNYCDSESPVDSLVHMVAIAGWDDFISIAGPPVPRAWLIGDSLSEDLHDGEYLWISYYDTVFLKENSYAVSFVAASGEGYDRMSYQFGEGAFSEPVTKSSMYKSHGYSSLNFDSWGSSRFIAREDGSIKTVGLILPIKKNLSRSRSTKPGMRMRTDSLDWCFQTRFWLKREDTM